MTTKYINTPSAVGEFTVKAVSSNQGFPISLEVESFVTLRPSDWLRAINVVSQQDAWIFSLPYQPLKEDIESRWEEYRITFEAMNELSSIVEAYSILHTYYHQKPKEWNDFINKSSITYYIDDVYSSDDPYLDTYSS